MSWNDPSIKIEKAENGYTLEVRAPYKNPKDKSKMSCCSTECSMGEKMYVAKDEKECAAMIRELLPKLDMEYTSEKAFEDGMAMDAAE